MMSENQNLQLLTDKYMEEVRNYGILEVSINQYKDNVVFKYANNEEMFK